jgi:hypothetical protein
VTVSDAALAIELDDDDVKRRWVRLTAVPVSSPSGEGEQVGARIEAPKRVPKRGKTRWLSCTNAAKAQVDLEGRIHPNTAPQRVGCRSRLTCRSGDPLR